MTGFSLSESASVFIKLMVAVAFKQGLIQKAESSPAGERKFLLTESGQRFLCDMDLKNFSEGK